MPDRLTESYDRPLLALEQLSDAQRACDAGIREWALLAMLDAIDLAAELGDDAGRRGGAGSGAMGRPSGTRISGKHELFQ